MTEERCEPPPELRGVDGWHHVNVAGIERPVWWTASAIIPPNADYMEFAPAWIAPGGGRVGPLVAYHRKWRYIAPVATPAEVDALRAERDDARDALLRNTNLAAEQQISKRMEALYGPLLDADAAQITALRARVAGLEAAVEELIGPYTGGADNTLDDPYIMERARAALEGKP